MTAIRDAAARLWAAIDIYVLVILFPMLLIAAGVWEHGRAVETHTLYASAAEAQKAARAEIGEIAQREPTAMIDAGGRVMTAAMAVAELDRLQPIAERGAWLSEIRKPIAIAAVLGGGLALVAGVLGLLLAAQAGHAARRSRDQLIASFSRVHRALPFLLGALMAGIALGLVGVAVFEAISMWFWDRVSGNAMKLMLFGLIFAGLAIYGAFRAVLGMRDIFALSSIEPFDAMGRAVDADAAPGLWRLVRDVAEKQAATAPDAIVIAMQGGFYVTEHPVRLLPGETVLEGRTLHIPAPYLELFDDEELRGVIGHELAHFVGEDTAYSRHFNPIYTGLERALIAMHEASEKGFALNPAFRLGAHMMDKFDHAVKHWSRLREFEADRMSSVANGPRAVASSLLRTSVIAPIVDETLDRQFQEPGSGDVDLIGEMATLVRSRGWPEMREHIEDRAQHPTDTHPSTPNRIETLSVPLDEVLVAHATRPLGDADTAPGARLFADWLAVRRQLSADFVVHARDIHAQHHANLQSAAEAVGEDDVVLYENVGPMMWVTGITTAFFGLAAASVLVFIATAAVQREPIAFAILFGICLFFALAFGWFTLRLRARKNVAVMTLTKDALITPRLAAPLRWLDIYGYDVQVGSNFAVVFAIEPEAAMPERAALRRRTKIDKKKRLVILQCFGIRHTKPQAFADLIGRYLHAANARAALAA